MAIQWGLAQGPNSFENAFQKGAQMGQAIKQQRTQNALSEYVTSRGSDGLVATPEQQAQSDQAWQTLVKSNPQLAMQIRQQEMQQEALRRREVSSARKEQLGAIPTTISMLRAAKANPQAYQSIRAQAMQLGIPGVENSPEVFDPAWVDQQLMTLQAFDKDGGQALTEAGKYAREYGLSPEDPRYRGFITEFLNNKFAQPYTGAQGETRVRYPNFAGPGQQQKPPQAQIIPNKPAGLTDDQIWSQAHEAVRGGANADDVFRQLQAWGMKP